VGDIRLQKRTYCLCVRCRLIRDQDSTSLWCIESYAIQCWHTPHNVGRTTSNSNCRHKRKPSEMDVQVLTRIVFKTHKSTAAKLIVEFNAHLDSPLSRNTSQYSWSGSDIQTLGRLCKCQMSVSIVLPTVQIMGCGQCETCSLMSQPSPSFPHLWELQCGEAPKRLNTQTVAVQSEPQGWAFPTVLDKRVTAEDYQTFLEQQTFFEALFVIDTLINDFQL